MTELEPDDNLIEDSVSALIYHFGGDPTSYEGELISQILETGLKLMSEGHDIGQLKVIARSIKEMRYAYRVFNHYKEGPCISIFGSARTPENHPDYIAAKEFSTLISDEGWMCITGAANGIMKASTEGPQITQSFGLSIRLPFEAPSNAVIEGDPKLIFFRYFFTRKLMFMSHSHAMAAFPGGFGTQDELFEMLTLIQTGKANIIPIVLIEGKDCDYWQQWEKYVNSNLLTNRWISPEDVSLYYLASSPEDAVKHILKFYSRYHSSRYVKDFFVIRINETLTDEQVKFLNQKYKSLVASKEMTLSPPLEGETDHLDLPRLIFHHTRKDFGRLRRLIDEINLL